MTFTQTLVIDKASPSGEQILLAQILSMQWKKTYTVGFGNVQMEEINVSIPTPYQQAMCSNEKKKNLNVPCLRVTTKMN